MKNIFNHLKLTIFFGVILLIGSNQISHAKKIFYDSKSWIVNVAGDPQFLITNGYATKIEEINLSVVNPLNEATILDAKSLAIKMTNEGYGKKFINALTMGGKSDQLLQSLALANVQRQDIEFGSETLRGGLDENSLQTYLKDEYLPILTHNYYCFTYTSPNRLSEYRNSKGKKKKLKGQTFYAIYEVEVTNEEAFDIIASIGDPSRYDKLEFPVKFICCGIGKNLEKDIEKYAPDLALRGVLTQRNPARISLGKDANIRKGDLVSIYSQRIDKQGNPYSKRISRARVGYAWEEESQINFEAGTAGNRKNGDVVVRTRDKHTRLGIIATWQPNVWGGMIMGDTKAKFMKSGIIHHVLYEGAFSMTTKPGSKFVNVNKPNEIYKSPLFVNAGIGYGVGKTFLGFMDIMPYFLAQGELGIMPNYKGDKTPVGFAARVPIGIRFSFNIAYPVKFLVEGGYAFNFNMGRDGKMVKEACDFLNAKRDGVFINAGFIF
ncbi:MAG: hypothetical protein J1F67_07015 [Muribaculaceae bacterium]|nr:hypothetical protein [Muribaculaceae bacterium]